MNLIVIGVPSGYANEAVIDKIIAAIASIEGEECNINVSILKESDFSKTKDFRRKESEAVQAVKDITLVCGIEQGNKFSPYTFMRVLMECIKNKLIDRKTLLKISKEIYTVKDVQILKSLGLDIVPNICKTVYDLTKYF